MVLAVWVVLWAGVWGAANAVWTQQRPPDDARRRGALETIKLPGGARVEFKSFSSPSLGQDRPYSVFLPPSYDTDKTRKYPVVYFLHGLNNDHTSWTVERYGRLHEKLEAMVKKGTIPEIIMVHPKDDNSFYTNTADGKRPYEDFIVKDLVQHVETTYRVKKGREYRAIGGTSMGGYGALKVAMRHPDLYATVVGHSPIVFPQESPFGAADEVKDSSRFYGYFRNLLIRIYGDPINREHWEANNLLVLATQRRQGFNKLKIYFDYGTADRYNGTIQLGAGCQKLHRILDEQKVPHVFKEHANEPHGWELVSSHFAESVPFLCQTFGK